MSAKVRLSGLSVSGGKKDKSVFLSLDYYKANKRLVLNNLQKNFYSSKKESCDNNLITALLNSFNDNTLDSHLGIGITSAISLPPFFTADNEEQIHWMNQLWENYDKSIRPFSPYLQRPVEVFYKYKHPERIDYPVGLSANSAPSTCRSCYLVSMLPQIKFYEIFAKATLRRLLFNLDMPKKLEFSINQLDLGSQIREDILLQLTKTFPPLFIYENDREELIQNLTAFNAFLAALNLWLLHVKQCEKAPPDFPKSANWYALPRQNINWHKLISQL